MSFMPTFVLGGEYARRSDADTAFGGNRRTRYVLNIATIAPTAELLDADRAWVRSFWTDLVPHATGIRSFVNFMSEFKEDRIHATYGADEFNGFAHQGDIDPENIFHLNANTQPAMTSTEAGPATAGRRGF